MILLHNRLQGVNPGQAVARVIRETLAMDAGGNAGTASSATTTTATATNSNNNKKEPAVISSVLLLDLLYAQPNSDLSALADYLTQFDNLSHVLCWSKSVNAEPGAKVTYVCQAALSVPINAQMPMFR